MAARRTLVTGGVRSGKSTHAESLLAQESRVTYVATGPVPDPDVDPEWAKRIEEHKRRRPSGWTTVETTDVASILEKANGAVIVECLATWVTATLDSLDAWDSPATKWDAEVVERADAFVHAWSRAHGPVVAVTNEVGMGVVPEHRSGRVFRDVLGALNQRIATVSHQVDLVIAGRVLHI